MEHGGSSSFAERMRSRLEQMKADALARRQRLREWGLGEGAVETAADLSSIDQHTADHGTTTYERTRDFGLLEEAALQVEEAEAALERLERGEYGQCVTCGRPIGTARLEALPTATRCADCARQEEARRGLSPDPDLRPSIRAGTGEGWRSPAYARRPHHQDDPRLEDEEDRQDVWSALGDYPSANSPQDEPDRARRREP